ncbi:hypothetical protein PC39_08009 [Salinisphaera sp. PC39]|uniref:DUF2271 domain-containing protein n=1 Tax=Salinisphaera sp. PC39 TaxID=1304156 RepID=UPI00333E8730
MRLTVIVATLAALVWGVAQAAGPSLRVEVEIPRLRVAEYHPPYVAFWIEGEGHAVAANLAVWYEIDHHGGEGEKWLKDLRQWWRRSGRGLDMPVDGVAGATRRPGRHTLTFDSGDGALSGLAPGDYRLVVEAAREVGGREVRRLDFHWPPRDAHTLETRGEDELGEIKLHLVP